MGRACFKLNCSAASMRSSRGKCVMGERHRQAHRRDVYDHDISKPSARSASKRRTCFDQDIIALRLSEIDLRTACKSRRLPHHRDIQKLKLFAYGARRRRSHILG